MPVRQGVSTTQTLQNNFICEMTNQLFLVLRVTDDNWFQSMFNYTSDWLAIGISRWESDWLLNTDIVIQTRWLGGTVHHQMSQFASFYFTVQHKVQQEWNAVEGIEAMNTSRMIQTAT